MLSLVRMVRAECNKQPESEETTTQRQRWEVLMWFSCSLALSFHLTLQRKLSMHILLNQYNLIKSLLQELNSWVRATFLKTFSKVKKLEIRQTTFVNQICFPLALCNLYFTLVNNASLLDFLSDISIQIYIND